jgi:hypothetical protein
MYLADDPTTEKVTQLYIWVHDMNTNVDKIFNAEKKLIVKEYDKYINLLKSIPEGTNINLPGSIRTFIFPNEFYNNIITDLERIKTIVNGFIYNKDSFTIRQLRQFKVVTAITKGAQNRYFMSGATTNYTKGKIDNPYIAVAKKPSQSFFDFAFKTYRQVYGGNNKRKYMIRGGNIHERESRFLKECFITYEYDNEIDVKQYDEYAKYEQYGIQIGVKTLDLHEQFINDFLRIFNAMYKFKEKYIIFTYGLYIANSTLKNQGFKDHILFNCFNDVIDSFAMIDTVDPLIEYYSEAGISFLVKDFFENEIKRHKNIETEIVMSINLPVIYNPSKANKPINLSKANKPINPSAVSKSASRISKSLSKSVSKSSALRQSANVNAFSYREKLKQEILQKKRQATNKIRGLVKGGSKTRKNRK